MECRGLLSLSAAVVLAMFSRGYCTKKDPKSKWVDETKKEEVVHGLQCERKQKTVHGMELNANHPECPLKRSPEWGSFHVVDAFLEETVRQESLQNKILIGAQHSTP